MTQVTILSRSQGGKDSDIFGFVGYNTKTDHIVVSYEGSHDVANWIENINFLKTPYEDVSGAAVHRGFYQGAQLVQDDYRLAVDTLLT